MMDFEDIVDMDWLNSHTVDSSLPSPPMMAQDMDCSLFNHDSIALSDDFMDYQESEVASPAATEYTATTVDTATCTDVDNTTTTTATPPPPPLPPAATKSMDTTTTDNNNSTGEKEILAMPSIDQIKQLIELAKKHIALREQLAANNTVTQPTTPEPETLTHMDSTTAAASSIGSPSAAVNPSPVEAIPNTPESISSTTMPDIAPPTELLVCQLTPTENNIKLEQSEIPETISPQSLLMSTSDAITTNTITAVAAAATTADSAATTADSAAATTDAATDAAAKKRTKKDKAPKKRTSALSSLHEDTTTMSFEAIAESDGIDLKKLTALEKRQLRNKISARNFRTRRREYITTLESQVDDQKKANEQLLHRLNTVEEENKQLKLQIDSLKRQNHLLSNNNMDKDLGFLGSIASEIYSPEILVS